MVNFFYFILKFLYLLVDLGIAPISVMLERLEQEVFAKVWA